MRIGEDAWFVAQCGLVFYYRNKSVLFAVRRIVLAADLSVIINVGKFGKDCAGISKGGKSM